MKFFPLCLCVCVSVCVRNSKIKYFCVYKSEYKKKILHVVEKILEIPTGKIGENSRNTNGENKIRGVVEKILEIPTGKRKFGEIRPTKKIRWLETNALDPHTWRAYVDQYSRQGTCSTHPQNNNNVQQTRHVLDLHVRTSALKFSGE